MVKKKMLALALVLLLASVAGTSLTANSQGLTPMEELGKKLFFDKISDPDWMSCATCHSPSVGFTGPIPGINKHGAVYRGAVPQRFGNRKPPSSGYATVSPALFYDDSEGLFAGGNFWDGRATGWVLGNPAADQAQGPFLNPVEQNNPDEATVVNEVCEAKYADLFVAEFQNMHPGEDPCELGNVEIAYDFIALAIAAFEDSDEVNQFSSKFDAWLAGEAELTEQEMRGWELFNGEAKCAACHPAPLFTDFTYDNLGVPRNPENPFYGMNDVLLDDGAPINPLGMDWVDFGLGGFLRSLADPFNQGWRELPFVTNVKDLTNEELLQLAGANDGKHKVPTLRNVDKRPGNRFPKAYMHNGVFKSLKEVVHFYNTRDVEEWPPPEVSENVNTEELGDLGLTEEAEDAIVAFMKTLSDGFKP